MRNKPVLPKDGEASFCIAAAALLVAIAIAFCGCYDKNPPIIREETVDLDVDSLDGQWDVYLEIWESGDRTNVYKSHLRFNVSASAKGGYDFSVYRVKEGAFPESLSKLQGFRPENVKSLGHITVESSDTVHIAFDGQPEYIFKVFLEKNANGKMVGAGNVLSDQTGQKIIAALQMSRTRKWQHATAEPDACTEAGSESVIAGFKDCCAKQAEINKSEIKREAWEAYDGICRAL
ncbi:MAG: hypothetical protein FWG30_02830 [Eubacteriaceae bacterium]|nr:hypothetical protein [Eubacteriaceae bacterium]